MRLSRLSLRNYGCFQDLDLELATEPGRITLVTAPNGSGKSVLRQAFHDVLFDIPKQSSMKFRHGYPGMAIHAEAVDRNGTPFGFGWVRNGKPERVTSDPARFANLRAQVGSQQLETLFLLDTDRLREGGIDLKGSVSLSEALLAGTGELAPAKAVRAVLGQRREQNWGRRRSTPPLNQAVARLDVTTKRLRAAVEQPEVRERQERDLQDRKDGLDRIRQEVADAATELRMLNRVLLTRPHLDALRATEEWLEANPDAPALPAGLDAALSDARAALVIAQAGHATATRNLALAREAMDGISREGESPAAVAAVMEALVTLEGHHRQATSLEGRVRDMQADLRRFAADVSALATEAGQPTAATVPDTARALINRSTAASVAEARWVQAREAVHVASTAAEEARAGLDTAQVRLDAVVASCGSPDADAAEARIAASRAHAEQVTLRDQARQVLLEHGDGLPTATLLAEALSVVPDDVPARRQAAEELTRSAQRRAEDARVEVSDLQAVLDRSSGSMDALEAQADHEAAVATFDRLLEDQIVLQVASGMLDDAMREVEDGTGGSVLARINGTFSSVTEGAYALELHDGPAGEELHAVERRFPAEHKGLGELSEGTRDQLYLALRMEALRDHCRSATPVPFIVDDVLQTFDDGRATAALRALCTLANDLQVVVLSHHPHVEVLARALGDGAVNVVRLPE